MSYFNHAFKKVFVATKTAPSAGFTVVEGILDQNGVHVSDLKLPALGPGVVGFFDAKTDESISSADMVSECCSFYIGGAAIKLNDKQGPFHGGYQASNKSKEINPKFLRKMWQVKSNPLQQAITTVGDDGTMDDDCLREFLCGETYYLRIDVKGTPALRFANHNLYRTLDASGGCCVDPSAPEATDPREIYLQWATQIVEDQFLQSFIRPVIMIEGDSYAQDAEAATALGIDPLTHLFEHIPALIAGTVFDPLNPPHVGIALMGAYVDTVFGNCSFEVSDYYGVDPIQIYASEVDLNGDPCTFNGICTVHQCEGVKPNGLGESKVRELILSESYAQNFMANDQRIREITQGTEAYNVLSRNAFYSSFFLLHSVPRYSNPSGTFDNDQYLLEIVGSENTVDALNTLFTAKIANGCLECREVEDLGLRLETACTFVLPIV